MSPSRALPRRIIKIVKRITNVVVALVIAVVPLLPMPVTCGRMMMNNAAMHPCCPIMTVRVPVQRATLRAGVTTPVTAPRLLPKVPAVIERVAFEPVTRDHFWNSLTTIQLRV